MIFETPRLLARYLTIEDADSYYDMMGNPNVMNPIPRSVMSRIESDEHLTQMMNLDHDVSDQKIWAIDSKEEKECIGICAFLKNNEGEDEIGYRLREKFWRKGYGREIAKGLINYGFDIMNLTEITADVDVENVPSVKILDKLLKRDKEFFNQKDNCMDRRYKIDKESWLALHI